MIKGILAFIVIALIVHFGINAFRKLHKLEKWNVVKTAFYSLGISALALTVLTTIVVLF